MGDYFPDLVPDTPKDERLPAGCMLLGSIPDPRVKKTLTQSERENAPNFHSVYGGSINVGWFHRLNLCEEISTSKLHNMMLHNCFVYYI